MTPEEQIILKKSIALLAFFLVVLYFLMKPRRPWPCPDCHKADGVERPCAKHRDGRFGGYKHE